MAPTVNVLFSQPPPHVSDAEFTAWYTEHMKEILEVPEFTAAQLFRVDPEVTGPDSPVPYGYAVVYEVEDGCGWATALAGQDRASLRTYEQYVERKKVNPSGPPIPEWLTDTKFAWWNGTAATPRIEAER
jgi:hypothetical protein